MVQIIQSQPTQRQSAFMDSIGQFANNFGNAYMDGQKTMRQQALADQDTAIKLNMAGYAVDQNQVAQARQGGVGGLFENRTQEFQDKQELEKAKYARDEEERIFDRDFKRNQMANSNENTKFQRQKADRDYEIEQQKLAQKDREIGIGKAPAQNEYAAAGYAKRARMSMEELKNLPKDVGSSTVSDGIQGANIMGYGLVPNAFKSDQRQSYEQVANNFISAVLRKESGASISPTERQAEFEKYFAQPGDSDQVIAQKDRSREQTIANLEAEGGRAMDRVATVGVPQTNQSQVKLSPLKNQATANPVINHPQTSQAMEWAKKNPSDPRAQKIMQRIGGE